MYCSNGLILVGLPYIHQSLVFANTSFPAFHSATIENIALFKVNSVTAELKNTDRFWSHERKFV